MLVQPQTPSAGRLEASCLVLFLAARSRRHLFLRLQFSLLLWPLILISSSPPIAPKRPSRAHTLNLVARNDGYSTARARKASSMFCAMYRASTSIKMVGLAPSPPCRCAVRGMVRHW